MRDEIDECAADEGRNRSNWIVFHLQKKIDALKAQRALDAGGKKLIALPAPTSSTVAALRVAEEPTPAPLTRKIMRPQALKHPPEK